MKCSGPLARFLLSAIMLVPFCGMLCAQAADTVSSFVQAPDTLLPVSSMLEDTLLAAPSKEVLTLDSLAEGLMREDVEAMASAIKDSVVGGSWSPDPSRATWTALAFPGGGQIYNRKYWKLPIIYGGFLGCAYALNWNNQMYNDYSQAYLDIMDDDPATASFKDFLPPRYDVAANEAYLKKIFKNRKDLYRRYRDLSIFSFVGVYLLSVIDAYVDAELSHFDISDDLGLHLHPSMIQNNNYYTMHTQSYGLQCCFTF